MGDRSAGTPPSADAIDGSITVTHAIAESRETPAAKIQPPGANHSDRLAPRAESVIPLDQVIQRPEQQRRVKAVILDGQGPCIAQRDSEGAMCRGRFHVPSHWIDEKNIVTSLRKSRSVRSGGASDVDDPKSGVQPIANHRLGSLELQQSLARAADKTITLIELCAVVGKNSTVDVLLG